MLWTTSLSVPSWTSARWSNARGVSLLDLVFALAVIGIIAGSAGMRLEHAVADVRERGAARAFAVRIRQVRAEAVRQSKAVGLQFVTMAGITRFRAFADGNGNGLRTREIAAGTDPPLTPPESLADASGAVRFALDPAVPEVGDIDSPSDPSGGDGGGSSAGAGGAGRAGGADRDPIRLGASDLLTFGATGSGTSGTIYLRGPTRQFAVRVYGPTGRIRLLEFRPESRTWVER